MKHPSKLWVSRGLGGVFYEETIHNGGNFHAGCNRHVPVCSFTGPAAAARAKAHPAPCGGKLRHGGGSEREASRARRGPAGRRPTYWRKKPTRKRRFKMGFPPSSRQRMKRSAGLEAGTRRRSASGGNFFRRVITRPSAFRRGLPDAAGDDRNRRGAQLVVRGFSGAVPARERGGF